MAQKKAAVAPAVKDKQAEKKVAVAPAVKEKQAENKKSEIPNEPTINSNDDSINAETAHTEYEQLLLRIRTQNEVYNELKLKLIELECEECTCNNACCIEQIRLQMEVEKENIRLLVKEVIKFQQDHPKNLWDEIEIATNLSEDNIPDCRDAAVGAAMLRMRCAKECREPRSY